jgi:hypothetical protein
MSDSRKEREKKKREDAIAAAAEQAKQKRMTAGAYTRSDFSST